MEAATVKVCLLGDMGVGKTSLTKCFVSNEFSGSEETTVGAAYETKVIRVEDEFYKFCIWDTAGQERFRSLGPLYYRGAEAVMIVYDTINSHSLDNAKFWYSEVQKHISERVIIVLIGNKCDRDDWQTNLYEEMDEFAVSKHMPHFQTSAKTGHNVEKAFMTILQSVISRQKKQMSTLRSTRLGQKHTSSGCC